MLSAMFYDPRNGLHSTRTQNCSVQSDPGTAVLGKNHARSSACPMACGFTAGFLEAQILTMQRLPGLFACCHFPPFLPVLTWHLSAPAENKTVWV